MEASTADHLLIKSVDDITESWVRELLLHRCDLPDPKPPMQVKSWVKGKCPSGDPLAGFSSTRATVQVAYEVEGEGGTLRKETFVVKLIPTLGFMSELLVSEGMHHNEVGQYKHFLRSLAAWEAERRGVSCGVLCEMIPPHSLAVSCDQHFTLVLPELRELGYTATNMPTGLDEDQIMLVVKNIGCFHGSVVAFKTITGVNLEEAFPKCFLQTSPDSPLFSTFTQAGFDRLKEEWAGDPSRAQMLEMLEPYETHAAPFIISGLQPKEPFATAIHGDLQPSNLFFKEKTDGEHTIKVIDWALARYSQGPYDLVYLMHMGVNKDTRRKVMSSATEEYYKAFNEALTDLGAGMTYPRHVFEEQLTLGKELMIIWGISSINLFSCTLNLKERLHALVADLLHDPDVKPPRPPFVT
ncbi:uncharacterized protein LOC119576384 isoform X3 [Penaeus monodon]|nr:uncharacterized protein LOC119576384 isoform X3 [Penaeus monodon]XP_037779977.1 uncharacterized protein LOC119576384 isoform X3 [Penaeus monodon]